MGDGAAPAARPLWLLERMRGGDRHAAAEFIIENAGMIRRRFRNRISRSVRRLFDSQDLVSTLARRLDQIVERGSLGAGSVGELWSLVMVLATYSLSEHSDKALRHRDFRDPHDAAERLPAPEGSPVGEGRGEERAALEECLRRVGGGVDAAILVLRLGGRSHACIAELLGLSIENTRKRWQRIRETLRGTESER